MDETHSCESIDIVDELQKRHQLFVRRTEHRLHDIETIALRHKFTLFMLVFCILVMFLSSLLYTRKLNIRIVELNDTVEQLTELYVNEHDELRCPICNWPAKVVSTEYGYRIECLCPACGVHTEHFTDINQMLIAWNSTEVFSGVF